jgi:hypothetical protein
VDRDLVDGASAGQTPIMTGDDARDLWSDTTPERGTGVVRAVDGPLVTAQFANRGRVTVAVRHNRVSIGRVEPLIRSRPSKG